MNRDLHRISALSVAHPHRSPDSRPGSFVLHDALSSLASSPGKRVNGSAF
jgi:hypothetical protein